VLREPGTVAAAIVNRARLVRIRSGEPHVFVPIRSMQFQAIIAAREVLFVDHQGGYAIENGVGGRLVALVWLLDDATDDASLSAPVSFTLVGYRDDARALHTRILSELPRALEQGLSRLAAPGQGRAAVLRGPGAPTPVDR
jgi:hypothetical protein